MKSITGHCAKCGAPYFQEQIWHGIQPPPVEPICGCWNIPKYNTTTGTSFIKEAEANKQFSDPKNKEDE